MANWFMDIKKRKIIWIEILGIQIRLLCQLFIYRIRHATCKMLSFDDFELTAKIQSYPFMIETMAKLKPDYRAKRKQSMVLCPAAFSSL